MKLKSMIAGTAVAAVLLNGGVIHANPAVYPKSIHLSFQSAKSGSTQTIDVSGANFQNGEWLNAWHNNAAYDVSSVHIPGNGRVFSLKSITNGSVNQDYSSE